MTTLPASRSLARAQSQSFEPAAHDRHPAFGLAFDFSLFEVFYAPPVLSLNVLELAFPLVLPFSVRPCPAPPLARARFFRLVRFASSVPESRACVVARAWFCPLYVRQ